ncbi:hypothetical protein J1N35_003913 [Gossypium stocksii]|uniref:Reverse transcriptase zinc-binding domain-containing protein n=1 Tax=Gossypium stocksii TaxID=47602 RepID=A0A9D4AHI7_9ROSI|nr:hypothetical protein J1N35_003913 [Gossypium stocksii]
MRNVYVVIWQLTRVIPGAEAEAETSLHALRDCSFAKHVWRVVTPVTFSRIFLYMHIDEWVLWNVRNDGGYLFENANLYSLFPIICWRLWKCENSFVFNDEDSSGREALLSCLPWLREWTIEFATKVVYWVCCISSMDFS